MTGFPTIDGIASALSLVLAALASLRAASRLERRIWNSGSIGLMDGPPILGPTVIKKEVAATDGHDRLSSPLRDVDGLEGEDDRADGNQMAEASPLWEHTEAFRRAVILGLVSDEIGDGIYSSIFSDVTRSDSDFINVEGGSEEDFALAAAVEAGLVAPRSTLVGGGARHRVRGGEASAKLKSKYENNSSSNPLGLMTSWLIRELSAPMAALPAWHGLFCSYLRQKKENKLRESQWCLLTPYERLRFWFTGKSSGKVYDPSGLDFDASISASARIPSGVVSDGSVDSLPSTKAVRVKAIAPETFRDLRNKCFRMNEKDYARSVLNAMNEAISVDNVRENGVGVPIPMADPTMSDVFNGNRIGQSNNQVLPYISFQSNSKGAARAGTFFFFTADGAFMIKTVKSEEAKAFHEMLPEYHRFMSESVNNRNSLLTRIFGMYSVQFRADADSLPFTKDSDRWGGGLYSSGEDPVYSIDDEERVYLVMHSIFPSDASTFITERFDLKGSTVGRECSVEERRTKGANAVLKDLDLKREVTKELNEADSSSQNRMKGSRYGICIGKRRKTALMAQLERDVDLLHRCNVLDYSLLVGVADMEKSMSDAKSKATNKRVPKCVQNFFLWLDSPMPYYGAGMTKVNGGALSCLEGSRKGRHVMYYMGVIDFLQPWTVKKRLERDLKGLAGMDKSAISCVAPAAYASRFLKFVNSHVT